MAHASNAVDPEELVEYWPPIEVLLSALSTARKWIHLTSKGMSQQILGALRLLSNQGVSIQGIVSGARSDPVEEYQTMKRADEVNYLDLKMFTFEESRNLPHTKLIVIDGKGAIYGGANLTLTGWRKVATGDDQMQIELDPGKVRRMNNVFFSKPWVRLLGPPNVDRYPMSDGTRGASMDRAWT